MDEKSKKYTELNTELTQNTGSEDGRRPFEAHRETHSNREIHTDHCFPHNSDNDIADLTHQIFNFQQHYSTETEIFFLKLVIYPGSWFLIDSIII